jgi:hypothetical protein
MEKIVQILEKIFEYIGHLEGDVSLHVRLFLDQVKQIMIQKSLHENLSDEQKEDVELKLKEMFEKNEEEKAREFVLQSMGSKNEELFFEVLFEHFFALLDKLLKDDLIDEEKKEHIIKMLEGGFVALGMGADGAESSSRAKSNAENMLGSLAGD